MSGLKSDIEKNITPITFEDSVLLEKLKIESNHATNRKAVFINTDTGELYSAEPEDGSGSGPEIPGVETASSYNQSMQALMTQYDGDLATNGFILYQPQGRVDILVNGLSVDLGMDKGAYFSGDGGITARVRGDVYVGDTLYWNGSIANYELELTDVIDFDYLTTDIGTVAPTASVTIVGGNWGSLIAGTHYIPSTLYEEPPLESWAYNQSGSNYMKIFVAESATDLIETMQIAVDGVIETFAIFYPIGGITQDDKKIVDQLFKTYIVNGLTITVARGTNWNSFTI